MDAAQQKKERFLARLDDYAAAAERGRVAVSPFLTPAERRTAAARFAGGEWTDRVLFWGGYPTAERTCLFLLPDFYAAPDWLPDRTVPTDPARLPAGFGPAFDPYDGDPAATVPDPAADAIGVLLVRGSGYRDLTHRDYLGSLLGLGLERDAVGDILLLSTCSAYVICAKKLAPFLVTALEKVGSDVVRVCENALPADFVPHRAFAPITDTVASPRLDCVVAALASRSREAAQDLVRSGLVEVDFQPELRPDRLLTPPVVLSIRSVGRFRLLPFAGETRKGRLRLLAQKYL